MSGIDAGALLPKRDPKEREGIAMNAYQTPLEEFGDLPQEVLDQLYDIVINVPFVRNLTSPARRRAKDCPRKDGRIIVDVTDPHICEDMDYFRPTALMFERTGQLTDLRPNGNPNSPFGRWIREERRRCWDGYVRESDGEWVPGYMYWYLNYCPIMLSRIREGTKRADRVRAMPEFWEGVYWRFHYIEQASEAGKHGAELASRSKSKSYTLASILSHLFVLGENEAAHNNITGIVTASQKEYLVKDGVLNKFIDNINFCADNTQFPRKRLKSSLMEMTWTMGYRDVETDIVRGTQNTVIGVSSDEESKLRGKRAAKILIEEAGTFRKLLEMYNTLLPSVQEGDVTFGQIIAVGTSGDEESDFSGFREILYNPDGYNMYALPNVYDRHNEGRRSFTYFFPGYVNRKGCYNKDGVSDVTKALAEILMNRHRVKYNSSNPDTILRTIAEVPVTPAEAIVRVKANIFPVTDLTERLVQLDSDPRAFDDVYVADLVVKDDRVTYTPSDKTPIRDFPHKDNKIEGAVELFALPEVDKTTGKAYSGRYIFGCDPYDDDQSDTMSLGSIFGLDLWTDRIVAEYTGRPAFADDFYEICRRMVLYYNGRLNYEAHPYTQPVITPDGPCLWEDIHIGSSLFAADGSVTEVTDIPVDGEDDIYVVTLDDGRRIEATGGHWWVTDKGELLTTKDIACALLFGETVRLPVNGKVSFPFRRTSCDPYDAGMRVGCAGRVDPEYLYNDEWTRARFVRGMEDGQWVADGMFLSRDEALVRDVCSLYRSLGRVAVFSRSEMGYACSVREAAEDHVSVVRVEEAGRGRCKCVTVKSPDHLYLIGDYVVTRNCNKKGLFAYFSAMNSLYLLTDTLDFLKDKQLVREGFGNKSKGTTATLPVNTFARGRLRSWLLAPVKVTRKAEDNGAGGRLSQAEDKEITLPRLYTLRNRALVKELIGYNSEGNFDRVSAMGMLMLLREDRLILYQGDLTKASVQKRSSRLGDDPFFTKNYDERFGLAGDMSASVFFDRRGRLR